jgi:hypothetical protein
MSAARCRTAQKEKNASVPPVRSDVLRRRRPMEKVNVKGKMLYTHVFVSSQCVLDPGREMWVESRTPPSLVWKMSVCNV